MLIDVFANSLPLQVVWVIFTLGMAVNHAVYVHYRPVAYTQSATMIMLVLDLVGISGAWVVVHAMTGAVPVWLTWFLGIDFVVHVLSGVWVLAHWQSLSDHMRDFQRRALSRVSVASEFVYEQFDCALYVVTGAMVVTHLPLWLTIPLFVSLSAFAAAYLPTAGFASAPARRSTLEAAE